jgi:hypothetical protein
MMSHRWPPLAFLLMSLGATEGLRCQALTSARIGIGPASQGTQVAGEVRARSLLLVTASSALIPGAGQAMLGSRRAIVYAAAEVAGLVAYSIRERDGNRQRDQYRDLSRSVARAQFTPDGPAGDWDYYERMEKFAASGAFDVVPGGVVDPETDVTTYNGSMWLLARQTYWRDPNSPPPPSSAEYQSALAFYDKRAVPNEMRWSWFGSAQGYQQYKHAIAGSNSAFKRAEQTIGLVVANHILSAVDAFVSVRLRARQGSDGRVAVTASIPIGSSR